MIPEAMILSARSADAEIIGITRPTWEPFFKKIIILSPEDGPLPGADIIFGRSGHSGLESIKRMRRMFEMAAEYPCAALSEPDVMMFREIDVGPGELVCSYAWANTDPRFQAPTYPHAPWVSTGETFARLLAEIDRVDEGGYNDRVVAVAAIRAGIAMRAVGYSRNSLDTPQYVAEAVEAVRNGAACVHGVKSREVMETLMAAQ